MTRRSRRRLVVEVTALLVLGAAFGTVRAALKDELWTWDHAAGCAMIAVAYMLVSRVVDWLQARDAAREAARAAERAREIREAHERG
ncbi:hypothetical protein [Streptomyces sp. NPDC048172]|uniref:hypothetical protein n=1 Tax=Streptomyces sp. NPDC048172 TaxID=3365505 RepID=UPI00370FAC83